MSRFRITIRGERIELRGSFNGTPEELGSLANAVEPFGLCIASPLSEYNEETEKE